MSVDFINEYPESVDGYNNYDVRELLRKAAKSYCNNNNDNNTRSFIPISEVQGHKGKWGKTIRLLYHLKVIDWDTESREKVGVDRYGAVYEYTTRVNLTNEFTSGLEKDVKFTWEGSKKKAWIELTLEELLYFSLHPEEVVEETVNVSHGSHRYQKLKYYPRSLVKNVKYKVFLEKSLKYVKDHERFVSNELFGIPYRYIKSSEKPFYGAGGVDCSMDDDHVREHLEYLEQLKEKTVFYEKWMPFIKDKEKEQIHQELLTMFLEKIVVNAPLWLATGRDELKELAKEYLKGVEEGTDILKVHEEMGLCL